jgi:hypothetical protein
MLPVAGRDSGRHVGTACISRASVWAPSGDWRTTLRE